MNKANETNEQTNTGATREPGYYWVQFYSNGAWRPAYYNGYVFQVIGSTDDILCKYNERDIYRVGSRLEISDSDGKFTAQVHSRPLPPGPYQVRRRGCGGWEQANWNGRVWCIEGKYWTKLDIIDIRSAGADTPHIPAPAGTPLPVTLTETVRLLEGLHQYFDANTRVYLQLHHDGGATINVDGHWILTYPTVPMLENAIRTGFRVLNQLHPRTLIEALRKD